MNDNSEPIVELGLLGGTFDPVHKGHLNLALTSLEELQLDAIHLLPCGQPVHRHGLIASSKNRLTMLEMAVNEYSNITIDDRECRTKTPSYALTSLTDIRREKPELKLYYILGLDAFNDFSSWHRWQEIFSLVHIIVAERPGYRLQLAKELQEEVDMRKVDSIENMKRFEEGRIFFAELGMLEISSTMIKEKILANESLDEFLPNPIIDYIRTQEIYSRETVS